MKKKLIFLGPPGVGKGTIASMLSEEMGIPQISTGDIFRENIRNQTELGKKAQAIINAGKLVPDDITNEIVRERLKQPDCKSGFILDGYPRTAVQADALKEMSRIDAAVNFVASEEVLVERIAMRISCPDCKAVFNLVSNPPEKTGFCDNCGTKLVHRDDQKPEIVKQRLDVYNRETKPLIDYYEKEKLLININGEQPIEKVFADTRKALE